jgi:hypothetical protein
MWKKGRLRRSDYFLLVALPSLFAGVALLQTSLDTLQAVESSFEGGVVSLTQNTSAAARITAAIELLWICVYSVKASFLAQFRFHKPPFAYVSIHLTRLYWAIVVISGFGFAFTLTVPIILCPTSCTLNCQSLSNSTETDSAMSVPPRSRHETLGNSRHSHRSGDRHLEFVPPHSQPLLDTDISAVVAVSLLLIWLANFTTLHALVNAIFKSLSIFAVALAAVRLATLYTTGTDRIVYSRLIFWLVIEAAAAIILASISVYRIVVLDSLKEGRFQTVQLTNFTQYGDGMALEDSASRSDRYGSATRMILPPTKA